MQETALEDRIAALEAKIEELKIEADDASMRYLTLKTAFAGTCGPIVAAIGVTPDRLRDIRDQMSIGAIWLTFLGVTPSQSDRRGEVLSRELDDIFTRLMTALESEQKARPPEPLTRFEAWAILISSAGVDLSETQRIRLANILHDGAYGMAKSEVASELRWIMDMCKNNADRLESVEAKAAFNSLSDYARMRIMSLLP
jgi:hypothetical protein